MKTIVVIFTKEKLVEIPTSSKRYTFNTESDIKIRDLIKIEGYKTNLQVVEIKSELFEYYLPNGNLLTGRQQAEIDEESVIEELKSINFIKEVLCEVIN